MLITTMIAHGNGNVCHLSKWHYRPLITKTSAWIPSHRLRSDYHRIRRDIPRGGNEVYCSWRYLSIKPICTTSKHWYSSVAIVPSRCYSSSSSSSSYSSSSTTSIQGEERKDSDDIVTEATNMATSICGDDLSVRASSTFGGLKYYNTDIDNRFRVLFVLGGPGNYIRCDCFTYICNAV